MIDPLFFYFGHIIMKITFASLALCAATFALSPVQAGQFRSDDNSKNPFPEFSKSTVPCPKDFFDDYAVCRKLLKGFAYWDDIQGIGFEVKAGKISDGASIPTFFVPLIGERWSPEFVRAATLHDWYVYRIDLSKAYSYQAIQRMFYHALLDSNVDMIKAKIMYLAVLIGGNRHSLRINTPPEQCEIITEVNCLRNATKPMQATAKYRTFKNYDHPDFMATLEAAVNSPEFQNINPMNVNQIEDLAFKLRQRMGLPNDDYITIE